LSEADGANQRTTLVPGDLLAGKYRVERPIGEGRTAVVYEATNLRLDERVALKMLKSEMRSDPEMAARFTREAHALAKLRSEHVARAVDVEDLPDGTSIMVMEFLDGQTLESMIEQIGPLPLAQAADFVIQTCEGLIDAHARGIVHRDVKPENIFIVVRDGWRTVKLIDFGISKALVSNTASAIRTQAVMGSPVYMSPEQLRSTQSADGRADIWSLGAVFFELLTGKTAYDHEQRSLAELITAILEQPPRRLAEFKPDLPADLQAILDRCFEKELEKRYQNTVELALALLPFAPSRSRAVVEKALNTARAAGLVSPDVGLPPSAHLPIETHRSIPAAAPAAAVVSVPPVAPPAVDDRPSPAGGATNRVPRWAMIAAVLFALAGLALGVFVLARRGRPAEQAERIEAPPTTKAVTPTTEPVPPVAVSPPSPSLPVVDAPVRHSAPIAAAGVPPPRPHWMPVQALRPVVRSPPSATFPKDSNPPAVALPSPQLQPTAAVIAVAPSTSIAPTPAPEPAETNPALAMPAEATPGTVDAKGIAAIARAHAGEVRECFGQARMYNPDVKGRITVRAWVAPDGTATSSSLGGSSAHDARLEGCVVSTFGRWIFPAPAGGVSGSATYTFVFE
jgi:tRNA A-37 threonylcarbamoyl transferase component Bud32